MNIHAGTIEVLHWPRNRTGSHAFSFVSSINVKWGKETAVRLEYESEFDLASLKRAAGGAKLNLDEQAERIVVTLLHDLDRDVYNFVHKTLVKADKSQAARLAANPGQMENDDDLEAAELLAGRWAALRVWFSLPFDQKFSTL